MNVLKIYLQIIADAVERSWSFTSELTTTELPANDCEEFSDGDGFVQTSDGDHYSRLMSRLFLKDCFVELLLIHLSESCRPPTVGSIVVAKSLLKLARLVAQMLSKLAENLVNRIPADKEKRFEISQKYGEQLMAFLENVEHKDFVCSEDFVDVINSFVPLMSPSVLLQLMVLLLQSPDDCIEQMEGESQTLSHHGKLVVHILPSILDQIDSMQPEILTSIWVRLCSVLKLVPSNEVLCNSLMATANRMPQFALNVTQGVVSSLLKAGTPSSLNLMTALAADNENCKQMMISWFSAHKTWSRELSLPLYVDSVLFVLKACDKGLVLTYFLFITYFDNVNNGLDYSVQFLHKAFVDFGSLPAHGHVNGYDHLGLCSCERAILTMGNFAFYLYSLTQNNT